MKTLEDVKVGDTVWWHDVANGRGRLPTAAVVTKVGSKLIYIEQYTRNKGFRKESGQANDAYGHEYIIADLEAYQEELLKEKIARAIQQTHSSYWHSLPIEDLKEAARASESEHIESLNSSVRIPKITSASRNNRLPVL